MATGADTRKNADTLVLNEAWAKRIIHQHLNRVLSPTACQRLIAALRSAKADFGQIAQIAASDPYIAGRVVGLANLVTRNAEVSEILSIDRAVAVLGLRRVQMLAISVLVTGPLMHRDEPVTRRSDLWRWVLACGVAGDWLHAFMTAPEADRNSDDGGEDAKENNAPVLVNPERVVHGLIMGLGALVMYAGIGRPYARLLALPLRPIELAQREVERFTVSHHQVTLWSLAAMRCPEQMGSFSAALDTESKNETALQARAVELIGARIGGFESDRASVALIDLLPRLNIDPARMRGDQLRVLRTKTKELAKTLRIDLGDWLRTLRRPQVLRAGR